MLLNIFWVHVGYVRQVLGYSAQNITSNISNNALAYFLGAFGILLVSSGLLCAEQHNVEHLNKNTLAYFMGAFGILLTSSGLLCAEHNVENIKTCSCIFSGCGLTSSGSNIRSNVGSNIGSNIGSNVGSNVGFNVGSNVDP